MGRTKTLERRTRVNVWLLTAQMDELDQITRITGQTKTEAITEAMTYWINAQRQMINATEVADGR